MNETLETVINILDRRNEPWSVRDAVVESNVVHILEEILDDYSEKVKLYNNLCVMYETLEKENNILYNDNLSLKEDYANLEKALDLVESKLQEYMKDDWR